MPNLFAAKAAIEAEIEHAKQGLAHYEVHIEALEKAIGHIIAVDQGVLGVKQMAVHARAKPVEVVAKGAKAESVKYAKKAASAKTEKSGRDLPFTGGDYWLNLVTAQPQSGADILHTAFANLGFKPSKEQVQKMTQRVAFALNAMVKAGKIQDSGKGRERRFFKG